MFVLSISLALLGWENVIVDQREIQRLGKGCGKYPVSCVIRNMLVETNVIKPLSSIHVIDLTYGEGRFWALIPNAKVWAFDIRKLRWVRKPFVFINDTAEKWYHYVNRLPKHVDLVVADPPFMPYRRGRERRRHYEDGSGNIAPILRAAEKAARYYKAKLLVHFLWQAVPYGFKVIVETWFRPVISFVMHSMPTWFGLLEVKE